MSSSSDKQKIPIFTVASGLWSLCPFLQQIIGRATEYLCLKDSEGNNIFLDFLLVPLCIKIIGLQGDVKSEDLQSPEFQQNVKKRIVRAFNIHQVTVIVGDIHGNDAIMQCNQSLIYINPSWIGQAVCDSEKNVNTDFHQLLGVIKLLHEYLHSVTTILLRAEYDIRKEINPSAKILLHTPEKMGFVFSKKGEPKKGDMGFAGEEIMSGGYRFYSTLDESYGIPFKLKSIEAFKHLPEQNKFESFKIDNINEIINNVLKKNVADIRTDFIVRVTGRNLSKRALDANEPTPRKSSFSSIEFMEDEDEEAEDFRLANEPWTAAFKGATPYLASEYSAERKE